MATIEKVLLINLSFIQDLSIGGKMGWVDFSSQAIRLPWSLSNIYDSEFDDFIN